MRALVRLLVAAALAAALGGAPSAAFAWGATGHRLIGRAAVEALPDDVPAFLRTPGAVEAAGELAREPDRMKASGKAHDSDHDPGHFLDLGDDGAVFGGPRLDALPATREDYETALRAVGADSWKAGYLPYSIVEWHQQLAHDLAYWRVLTSALGNRAWAAHHAWYATDLKRREAQILEDIGELAHFVGDGSQPMHVTTHFNGWGPYPNPNGYTQARVHAPFEGAFVRANVRPAEVARRMTPLRLCDCTIEQRTADYLAATNRLVVPFYEMEKAGGLASADPRGVAFATDQIARGASELRDDIVQAWRASAALPVGYPAVAPADVAAGRLDPFPSLYGAD
jgi:hypothetical protein